jgi:hypothetical protein
MKTKMNIENEYNIRLLCCRMRIIGMAVLISPILSQRQTRIFSIAYCTIHKTSNLKMKKFSFDANFCLFLVKQTSALIYLTATIRLSLMEHFCTSAYTSMLIIREGYVDVAWLLYCIDNN